MLLDAVPNGLSLVDLVRVRPDSEPSGNPIVTPEEMLVCPCWQPTLLALLQPWLAPLLVGLF